MKLRSLLHAKTGPLTSQLELRRPDDSLPLLPTSMQSRHSTTAVCGFCSTGCGLRIHLNEDGEALGITPSPNYPVNAHSACPKGWQALTVGESADRATHPLLRDGSGALKPVSWDAAMGEFARRFKAIGAVHGPESVAFLSTGQIPTEEMALLGALAKFGMGMRHGDGNTRQCMATAVAAYKQSFGFDAPPYCYSDLEQSDVVLLFGSNLAIAHPILWSRLAHNPHAPEVITIDPRLTETARASSWHVPLQPGSDLVLLYTLANLLVRRGYVDQTFVDKHTNGFDALVSHVSSYTAAGAERDTGLAASDIERLADVIGQGKRVSFWWTMGVNQSHQGTRTAQGIINLALLTGNIGRPGTGANSITGQANAMGSRLFSNTTNLLGGHHFSNDEHRAKVAQVLSIDPARIPSEQSWSYDQIIEGILQDRIRGLWVIATNPAHSWINQSHLRSVFERLDFLVVQDMYSTSETAQMADLVLPAAGWGEKEGTFINSERRVGLIKKVRRAPGEALADFYIFKLVAHYWGCDALFEAWSSPEAVFRSLCEVSRGQPCDISGISGYAMLDAAGGVQWPFPEGAELQPSEGARLFEDGAFFTPDRRARFIVDEPQPLPEATSSTYPLLLLTGRGSSAQWHTNTRTGKAPVLGTLSAPSSTVQIHPADARELGLTDGLPVIVESRRGKASMTTSVTRAVGRGRVFIAMHDAATNRLTHAAFDPHSRQPAYKQCAVSVRPAAYWEPAPDSTKP